MTREQAKQIVKDTIYKFIDNSENDKEIAMTREDKLLLQLNKSICGTIDSLDEEERKELEQPTMDKAMIHTLAKENGELQAEIGRLREELTDKSYQLWKESYEEEHFRNIRLEEKIKALEKQPSEDCVSRKAVAEIINKQRFGIHQISMGIIKEKIESLPPVTPTQSWIPVSERIPKEGETVLVCYETQGGMAQSVCEWFDMPNRGIVWSTLCGRKPIAWQPLPKPYEEKRGGKNEIN